MSLISEVFSGYAERIRKENSLQLKRMSYQRPREVAIEITKFDMRIAKELEDPAFKLNYDRVLAMLQSDVPAA